MKKIVLTTIEYRMPAETSDGNPKVLKRPVLTVISSSRGTSPEADAVAAIQAVKTWFASSHYAKMNADLLSIDPSETIDADNPEPPALYTEADLVSFGNFMAQKILALELEDYDKTSAEYISKLCVWDSDLANWRGEQQNKN